MESAVYHLADTYGRSLEMVFQHHKEERQQDREEREKERETQQQQFDKMVEMFKSERHILFQMLNSSISHAADRTPYPPPVEVKPDTV